MLIIIPAAIGEDDIKLDNPDAPDEYSQMTADTFASCTNCDFRIFLQQRIEEAEKYLSNNYNADDAKAYFQQTRQVTSKNKEIFRNYLSGTESGSTFTGQNKDHALEYLTQGYPFNAANDPSDKKIAEKYCSSVSGGNSQCDFTNAQKIETFPPQTSGGPSVMIVTPISSGSVGIAINGENMDFKTGAAGGHIEIKGNKISVIGEGTVTKGSSTYSTTSL